MAHPAHRRTRKPVRLPSSAPPRQYRCSMRNRAISGTIVMNPPVTSKGSIWVLPADVALPDRSPSPTVIGYRLLRLKMISGRK